MALVLCVQHNERVDQFLSCHLLTITGSNGPLRGPQALVPTGNLAPSKGEKNQNSVDLCSNLQQGDDFCRNLVLSLFPRPHRCCSSYACQNPCSFSSTFMASPHCHLCLENYTTIIMSSHLFKFAHRSIKQWQKRVIQSEVPSLLSMIWVPNVTRLQRQVNVTIFTSKPTTHNISPHSISLPIKHMPATLTSLVFILDTINITAKLQDFTGLTKVKVKMCSTTRNDGDEWVSERGLSTSYQPRKKNLTGLALQEGTIWTPNFKKKLQ